MPSWFMYMLEFGSTGIMFKSLGLASAELGSGLSYFIDSETLDKLFICSEPHSLH